MPSKPSSIRSARSAASERSPLIPRTDEVTAEGHEPPPNAYHRQWRYSSFIVLLVVLPGMIIIIALGLTIPAAAERYAEDATVVKLEGVSVQGFTFKGVNLRVLATMEVDAERVQNFDARMIGRFGGFLLRKASTDRMNINLHLPAYGDALAAKVSIPPIAIDIRNGHSTTLNFTAYVEPGKKWAIMSLVNDALKNRLEILDVRAETVVQASVGWLSLPGQKITKVVSVDNLKDMPTFPLYKFGDIRVGEHHIDGRPVLNANASLSIQNLYAVRLDIPPLGLEISLPGCTPKDRIVAANALVPLISILPRQDIDVEISAFVSSVPERLTRICPATNLSPLDAFIANYLDGEVVKLYVSGDGVRRPETPSWIGDLLEDFIIPVPVPNHAMGDLIKTFSMTNVDISLPTPGVDPGSPKSLPLVSADIEVLLALPQSIDIDFSVSQLRSRASISYEGELFGDLDIHDWVPASSEKIKLDHMTYLKVSATVKDAILNITDYSAFQKVVLKLLSSDKRVDLTVIGKVDAVVSTSLGQYVVRQLPAHSNITVDGLPELGSAPIVKAKDIRVATSTKAAMTLVISASIQNPTSYRAVVPYCNLLVLSDNYILGNVTVKDMVINKGENNVIISIDWAPIEYGGEDSVHVAEALISGLVSGRNTSVTLQTHKNTFPSMPALSNALSDLSITIPIPQLPYLPRRGNQPPGNGDDAPDDHGDNDSHEPGFIRSATMHLFSSTADFLIQNPFPHDVITIYKLNGSALYNGSIIGVMQSETPFKVQAGLEGSSPSPRIPVDWSLDSVGFETMKKALGGDLKINAIANCMLALGRYQMAVLFNASRPIKAHVRF